MLWACSILVCRFLVERMSSKWHLYDDKKKMLCLLGLFHINEWRLWSSTSLVLLFRLNLETIGNAWMPWKFWYLGYSTWPWMSSQPLSSAQSWVSCSTSPNPHRPSSRAGYQKTLDKSIFPDICPDLGHWHPQTIYLLFVMCSHNPALILFSGELQCWIIDWATTIGRTSKIKKFSFVASLILF